MGDDEHYVARYSFLHLHFCFKIITIFQCVLNVLPDTLLEPTFTFIFIEVFCQSHFILTSSISNLWCDLIWISIKLNKMELKKQMILEIILIWNFSWTSNCIICFLTHWNFVSFPDPLAWHWNNERYNIFLSSIIKKMLHPRTLGLMLFFSLFQLIQVLFSVSAVKFLKTATQKINTKETPNYNTMCMYYL